MHFSPCFFSLGKTNALRNKISNFQQLTDETIAEAWEHMQNYISACPHHGMEEWFIIQSFYHGLICTTHEHIDAVVGGSFFSFSIEESCKAGGSFFSFSIEETHKLIEKMASK
jgi:hypothetical protein